MFRSAGRSSLLSLLFCLLTPLIASAQVIHGRVTDTDGLPILGATVVDARSMRGCATLADGTFNLDLRTQLPADLIFRCIGFLSDTVRVSSALQFLDVVLQPEVVESQQVDVIGRKRDAGFESLDANLLANLVDANGGVEGVIKQQMGVSSNSELSSQYRVRGGNFDENIVYVNGIEIYRPFLIRAGEQEGLSFVNPDMVQELRFSAGGFDAAYGDKMSSVLDVTYKRPTATHWSVRGSLLGASAHLQGASRNGRFSHISGVRYKTNQYLFGSLDTKGDYAPSFFDAQTYWTVTPSERLALGILAYYAANRYEFIPHDRETSFGTISDAKTLKIYFEGGEHDRYKTAVAALDVNFRPSSFLSIGLVGSLFRTVEEENFDILGEYWLQQAAASQSYSSTDLSDNIGVGGYMQHARNDLFGEVYSGAATATLHFDSHNEIKAQFRATTEHYSDYTDEWEYTDSAGVIGHDGVIAMDDVRLCHNNLRQTRLEAYVVKKTLGINIGRGVLSNNSGFRFAHLDSDGASIFSFRSVLNFSIDRWRFRLAGGQYNQLPNLREMKRDDASLNTSLKPQRSRQVIAGADLFFGSADRPFKFTAEAYYKWLRDINPYSIDNVRLRYLASNCARGYAMGLDFKLNGELVEGVESWATFSLMKTMEDIDDDGHGYIPRPSDQRVQFSLMVQDYMPSNKSITAMLSMYFASGLPYGPSGSQRWQQTSRMPGYKRVDLGLYKDFARDTDGNVSARHLNKCQLGVEFFNLFDFANTISHFWVSDTEGRNYGVPNYLTSRRINVKLNIEF